MKKIISVLLAVCLCTLFTSAGRALKPISEIISIQTFDGSRFDGKLSLPRDKAVEKVVVFVNGSGPNTYDNHRILEETEFNYFDLFAKEFTRRGTAFFSYNTRGVTPSDTPPIYADIDEKAYQTYLPSNEVQDVEAIVRQLLSDKRLEGAEVYLLGWSAGSIIAPLVAKRGNVPISALLLAGYCNQTMEEILNWQLTGGSSMVFYRQYFDYDQNGIITLEELEQDTYQIKERLGISTIDALDLNGDGVLSEADFKIMLAKSRDDTFRAIESGDDAWMKENYGVRLTTAWFHDYRKTLPNRETLPTLDLPIHIFHGENDANAPVQDVYDIAETFRKLGKENLVTHVYDQNDHDLNYLEYIVLGKIPPGITAIFDTCQAL